MRMVWPQSHPRGPGRREGRCVSHRRKRKLAEPRIAARLTDAYETQRAGRSNGEGHSRAAALSCVRLLARESRPDLGAIASCVQSFRLALRERNRRCVPEQGPSASSAARLELSLASVARASRRVLTPAFPSRPLAHVAVGAPADLAARASIQPP